MKILILVDTYFPFQDGVQTVTQYIAEGLAEQNDVLVLTSNKNKCLMNVERKNNVLIERYNIIRNPFTMQFNGKKQQIIERIFKYQPDILIAVAIQCWCFDWLKHRIDKLPGKKILYTHGSSCLREYNPLRILKKLRLRKEIVADLLEIYHEVYWKRYKSSLPEDMKKFDKVIYLYDNDELHIFTKSSNLDNDIILENAVEDIFFERKAFKDVDKKRLTFVNVSSYVERKNQKVILEAFYEVSIPNTRLVLIGSKPTEYYKELLEVNEKLKQQYGEKEIQVDIYCGIERNKILEMYKNFDIYVSASEWEAMSISLCEAAAAGMSILSTDVGHVSNIPGVILCRNKDDFKNNMCHLANDSVLRKHNGQLAYSYALNNYLISEKVKKLEYILEELLNQERV